jgi:hypothetical protein
MSTGAAPGCGRPWRVEADDEHANEEAKQRDTVKSFHRLASLQHLLRKLTLFNLVVNSGGKDGVAIHSTTDRPSMIR